MPFQVMGEMGPFSISFILSNTIPSSAEPIDTICPSQLRVQGGGKERKSELKVSSLIWGGYRRLGKGGQKLHKGGKGRPLHQCQALHQQAHGKADVATSSVQMRRLRLRDIKKLTQSHTAQ